MVLKKKTLLKWLGITLDGDRNAALEPGQEGEIQRFESIWVRVYGPGPIQLVFDPIGGARQLWRSNRALRKGGRLVWFGVAATKKDGLRVIPITMLTVGLLKLFPGGKHLLTIPDLGADNAWYRQTLAKLLDMLAAGEINPIVSDRIPLAEAARAHELLERGEYAGKVVLVT